MKHKQQGQNCKDAHFMISMLAKATQAGYRVKVGSPEEKQIMRGECPLDMTVGQAEEWRPSVKWEWVPGVGLRESEGVYVPMRSVTREEFAEMYPAIDDSEGV